MASSIRLPKVDVDLRPLFKGEERGHRRKDMIVLHETVSSNRPGLRDITSPAEYLDANGLEIHGVIDQEGYVGWAYDPTAIYDHAASGNGRVNSRSVGFELVSEIPFLGTVTERRRAWKKPDRVKQLDTVAAWCAYLHVELGIPLDYSDATTPGITSHWDVSRSWLNGHGHWDCWPIHRGGHFPLNYVVYKARQIVAAADA